MESKIAREWVYENCIQRVCTVVVEWRKADKEVPAAHRFVCASEGI